MQLSYAAISLCGPTVHVLRDWKVTSDTFYVGISRPTCPLFKCESPWQPVSGSSLGSLDIREKSWVARLVHRNRVSVLWEQVLLVLVCSEEPVAFWLRLSKLECKDLWTPRMHSKRRWVFTMQKMKVALMA